MAEINKSNQDMPIFIYPESVRVAIEYYAPENLNRTILFSENNEYSLDTSSFWLLVRMTEYTVFLKDNKVFLEDNEGNLISIEGEKLYQLGNVILVKCNKVNAVSWHPIEK